MLGQVYKRLKQTSSQIFLGSQSEAETESERPVPAEETGDDNTGTHSIPSIDSGQSYWPPDLNEEDYNNVPEPTAGVKPAKQNISCLKRPTPLEDEFDLLNTDGENDDLMDLDYCGYNPRLTSKGHYICAPFGIAHAPMSTECPQTPTRDLFTVTGTQLEQNDAIYQSPKFKSILSQHSSQQARQTKLDDTLTSPSRRPSSRGQKPSANASLASTITAVSAAPSFTRKGIKKPSFISKLTTALTTFGQASPVRGESVFRQSPTPLSAKRRRGSISESPRMDTQPKRQRCSSPTAALPDSTSTPISTSPSQSHESLLHPFGPLATASNISSKASKRSKTARKCAGDRSWPSLAAWGFHEEVEVAGHPDFNDLPIGWGTKWEVQRHEKDHQWRLTPETLAQLDGPHAEVVPKIARLVRNTSSSGTTDAPDQQQVPSTTFMERENSVHSPWKEMDREEAAWAAGKDEGLGLSSPDGWFGGKIRFAMLLDYKGARAFSSKALIILRITGAASRHQNIKNVLKSRFMVFGRGYRTLDAQADRILLVDDGVRRPDHDFSAEDPDGRNTLHYMMRYLNPLKYNQDQSLVKWRARFHLYFSSSIPGYRLKRNQICMIDDEELPHVGSKCPNEKIATDGCGRVRIAVVKAIQRQAHWDRPVSAFQTRTFGAKGLLLSLMPDESAGTSTQPDLDHRDHSVAEIFLRPSQLKIRMDPRYQHDLAKLTVDVIRPAKLTMPSRLSWEAIQILSWNGVPISVFELLQTRALEDQFGPLVRWGEGPMLATAKCVEVLGRIMAGRRLRLAGGMARAQGLTSRDPGEADEGDEDIERVSDERSAPWWPDPVSGSASSLQEGTFNALLAGFRPESQPTLRSKMKNFLKSHLSAAARDFRIEVPKSLSALIVPDPSRLLKPGQISITRSEAHINEATNQSVYVLEGPCVVLRNPAKQETDVRKVMMVNCPELHHLKDLIIMPITDIDRTLASRLSGGDYDGDRVQVIWQEEIISSYQNAATDKALEIPPEVTSAFECINSSVSDFLVQSPNADPRRQQEMLQDVLLCPLGVKPGQYSIYHALAARAYGIGSREAIRLGYMFTESLDGAKTGKTVKADILAKDRSKYEKYGRCEWDRDDEKDVTENSKPFRELVRKIEGPFVLDVLKANGQAQRAKMLAAYEAHTQSNGKTSWKVRARTEIQGWIDECTNIKKFANSERQKLPNDVKHSIDELIGDFKEIDRRDADPSKPWRQRILQALRNLVKAHQARRLTQTPPCIELQYLSDLLTIRQTVMDIAALHWTKVEDMTKLKITDRQDRLRELSIEFTNAVPVDNLQVLGQFGTEDDLSAGIRIGEYYESHVVAVQEAAN
ncbi:hypothetical protein FRB98_008870 [Tulasnella sp. 332]|nr:hypothetical protein FRB98_008870 [Tulasnella sp. 332]